MAGIFVPHIKELLDSAKDIDINIVIENEDDISNCNLTKVIDDFVQSSYPYTRKSVINVHNYNYIKEIHDNIPWRHQIVFHNDDSLLNDTQKKHQLIVRNLDTQNFKKDWWVNLVQNLDTKGGIIYYD